MWRIVVCTLQIDIIILLCYIYTRYDVVLARKTRADLNADNSTRNEGGKRSFLGRPVLIPGTDHWQPTYHF